MDKLGKIRRHHQKERLKMSKIAKFVCVLLKTNEDSAPQSREILQTFVGWGAQTCPPPYHTNVCNFTNFKALFPVVSTGVPELVYIKSWYNREKVYFRKEKEKENKFWVQSWL